MAETTDPLVKLLTEHRAVEFLTRSKGGEEGPGWYCTCRKRIAGPRESWTKQMLALHQASVLGDLIAKTVVKQP